MLLSTEHTQKNVCVLLNKANRVLSANAWLRKLTTLPIVTVAGAGTQDAIGVAVMST